MACCTVVARRDQPEPLVASDGKRRRRRTVAQRVASIQRRQPKRCGAVYAECERAVAPIADATVAAEAAALGTTEPLAAIHAEPLPESLADADIGEPGVSNEPVTAAEPLSESLADALAATEPVTRRGYAALIA